MAAANIWLTDEDADISGYLRAKIGSRSDATSLVRAVTNTAAGPSTTQVTRTAAGTALAWITDPLAAGATTAATWTLHLWGLESNAAANVGFRTNILRFTNAEGGTVIADTSTNELGTATADALRTTGAATVQTINAGDRLVIKVSITDVGGTQATGYTATFSYNGQLTGAEGDSYLVSPAADTIAVQAVTPAATETQVRNVLMDADATTKLLTDAQIDQAIVSALREYSQDRPLTAVAVYSGDGTAINFRLPPRWIHNNSRLVEIETPADQPVRVLVDERYYEVLETALGTVPVRQLHFIDTTPASGTNNMYVRYTTRHRHDSLVDTIPTDDFDAFCYLAAAYCAIAMANKYASASDGSILADSTNYRDSQLRWKQQADLCRGRYDEHVGRGAAEPSVAASQNKNWDTMYSFGTDRLFHSRRRR